MVRAAFLIGILILLQGAVGLIFPEFFHGVVRSIQVPPVLYIAAAVRVIFGLILLLAAPRARFTVALRILGALILAGGLLTPFVGVQMAQVILAWWAHGSSIIYVFAGMAIALGSFITYATRPVSRGH